MPSNPATPTHACGPLCELCHATIPARHAKHVLECPCAQCDAYREQLPVLVALVGAATVALVALYLLVRGALVVLAELKGLIG